MNRQKRTILVVEDEKPLQNVIKAKLENSNYEVVCSRTAEQALEYLKELGKVELIWLDHYLLGKETGIDLVAKLKTDDSPWRSIPIFVVSNTATPEKTQTYLSLGVNKYYTKSNLSLDHIVEELQVFLEKQKE
jgi:CheY-like chemotaxis protein